MKTIIRLAACLMALSLLTGCATTRNAKEAVIANVDPFELGSFEASFSDFTGFMINRDAMTVDFAPRENNIVVNLKNQGNSTHIYLDETARSAMLSSIDMYFKDFESKSLRRKGKTNTAYGKVGAYMEWGLLMVNAKGDTEVRMGYEFVDKSPYFTLTIPETENDIYLKTGGSRVKRSGFLQIFFTRSQAAEFSKTLVQENLLGALAEKKENELIANPDMYDEPDTYKEADDESGEYVEDDSEGYVEASSEEAPDAY